MSISVKLDIKLWRPGHPERLITGEELRNNFNQLKTDEQFLSALMIDNFGLNLIIDGELVSRCTCMFDGESSPDLMYLYENHLLDLWQKNPVTIHFFEEMTAWNFIPEGDNKMVWQILDTSKGQSSPTVAKEGRSDYLAFIDGALNWLQELIDILTLYRTAALEDSRVDVEPAIDFSKRLLNYSHQTLVSHKWQPING